MSQHKVIEEQKGEIYGEVGVLCYRPHVCTVQTKRLSQLLRLSRSSLINMLQANLEDGTIIMNNLVVVWSFFGSSLSDQIR